MVRISQWIVLACALCVTLWAADAAAGDHRLGVGVHYWQTVENVDAEDVDEDGLAQLVTYQYWPNLLGFGVDLEWYESRFAGSDEKVYEPQAYIIFGRGLYAAAGIGGYYSDGDFADDPFYFFRGGVCLPILFLSLDINANYRFEKWAAVEDEETDIDTDTVTLGAAVRLVF